MWDWFMCLKVECGVIESTYHENHCNRIFRQLIPQGALYFIASITLLPSAIHQAAFLLFFFQACVTVIWLFKILNVHYLRCLVNCFSHLTNDQFPQTFWLHLVSKIKRYILCTQYLFIPLYFLEMYPWFVVSKIHRSYMIFIRYGAFPPMYTIHKSSNVKKKMWYVTTQAAYQCELCWCYGIMCGHFTELFMLLQQILLGCENMYCTCIFLVSFMKQYGFFLVLFKLTLHNSMHLSSNHKAFLDGKILNTYNECVITDTLGICSKYIFG